MMGRDLSIAIGIDLFQLTIMMAAVAGVLGLLLWSPLGEFSAFVYWIYGDGGDWLIWPYHITQMSILVSGALTFGRPKGTRGIRYLERSRQIALTTGIKRRYQLLLGLPLILILLVMTELVFCIAFDACLSIVIGAS